MAEVETTSFFGRIMNSLGGVLIGLLLIPASFGVLAISSCRERASEALQDAVPVEQAVAGKASYATGKIQANPIGDAPYVRPGPYLTLNRSVQIYAWKQTSEKDGEKTIYNCTTEWTANPSKNIGSEKGCRGKYNPGKRTRETNSRAAIRLNAGGKSFSVDSKADFYGMPSADITVTGLTQAGGYYYLTSACANSATVGCERISYSGTGYDPQAEYTVIGTAQGARFQPYTSKNDNKYLALGAGGFAKTLESIRSSDATMTMILFAISVAMLGGGLSMIVGPLLSLIEYIPLIGGFGAGLIRVIFFIIAAIVMAITYFFLRYWYVVLVLFLIVMGIVAYIAISRRKQAEAT
ncbi:MAG: TMEM43 family protein [bacterium]|nr:TMEM43 family protein [bacterium]